MRQKIILAVLTAVSVFALAAAFVMTRPDPAAEKEQVVAYAEDLFAAFFRPEQVTGWQQEFFSQQGARLAGMFGVTAADPGEFAEFTEIFRDCYYQVQFGIDDASESEGGYLITVSESVPAVFSAAKESAEVFAQEFAARNEAGEFSQMDEEEYHKAYLAGIMECVRGAAGTAETEEFVVGMRVEIGEDGLCSIRAEDLSVFFDNIVWNGE